MLLSEPISRTSKQCKDLVETFIILLDSLLFLFFRFLMSVEILLCLTITLFQNTIICFFEIKMGY